MLNIKLCICVDSDSLGLCFVSLGVTTDTLVGDHRCNIHCDSFTSFDIFVVVCCYVLDLVGKFLVVESLSIFMMSNPVNVSTASRAALRASRLFSAEEIDAILDLRSSSGVLNWTFLCGVGSINQDRWMRLLRQNAICGQFEEAKVERKMVPRGDWRQSLRNCTCHLSRHHMSLILTSSLWLIPRVWWCQNWTMMRGCLGMWGRLDVLLLGDQTFFHSTLPRNYETYRCRSYSQHMTLMTLKNNRVTSKTKQHTSHATLLQPKCQMATNCQKYHICRPTNDQVQIQCPS